MKIYFTASLTGKKQFGDNYTAIVEILSKKASKLYCDHIVGDNAEKVAINQTKEEAKRFYTGLLRKIKSCDIVVAEISHSSISVGHEISYALEAGKPVIALYTEGRAPFLLQGTQDDRFQLIEYRVDSSFVGIIDKALEEALRTSDVRFNFFVSPRILSYLDWVAKTKKLPRAVFLRNLIEREMKKDKAFRE